MSLFTEEEKEEIAGRGRVERENMIIKACLFFSSKATMESLLSLIFCFNMTETLDKKDEARDRYKGVKEDATNLCTLW